MFNALFFLPAGKLAVSMDFKAKDFGHEAGVGSFRDEMWIDLEQHAWEARSKVCAVDILVSTRLWIIYILAARAIEFHCGMARKVMETNWQKRIGITIHAGTSSKVAVFVFIQHLLQSTCRQYVSCMDQPIKMGRNLLYMLSLLLRHVLLKIVRDHVNRLLDVINFRVEPSQIEPVGNKLGVNVAEILIPLGAQEPVNPHVLGVRRALRNRVVRVLFLHP